MDAKTIVTIVIAVVAFIGTSLVLLQETIQPKLYVRCLLSDHTMMVEHPSTFSWLYSILIYVGAWICAFTFIWLMS